MHVRKRSWTTADGTRKTAWQVRWTDRGKRRSRTFQSKKAADAFRVRTETEQAAGVRPDADITVGVWLDRWLETQVAGRVASGALSPTTAVRYEAAVRKQLVPSLGAIPIVGLTVADVDSLMNRMIRDGYAAATARKARAVLSKALTDAMRNDLVNRNVAQMAEPPALPHRAPSAFTADELDRLVAVWRGHRYGPLLEFVLLTGLRTSEAVGLRWSDVDLEAATLTVSQGLHRVGGAHIHKVGVEPGVVTSPGKNAATRRPRPLASAAVQLLRKVRLAQPPSVRAAGRWSKSDFVFTSEVGGPVDPRRVREALVEVADQAGVPLTTADGRSRKMHELRRTWVTRLRDAGVRPEDLAHVGGWSSPRVLMDTYSASPDERLRDAVERAADGLG